MACCSLPALHAHVIAAASAMEIHRRSSNDVFDETEIYPQSLSGLKFEVIGHLIYNRKDDLYDVRELFVELQSRWNPSSTWRLIVLEEGYIMQFSCFADQHKIISMPFTCLARATMIVSTSAEYFGYKDLTQMPSVTMVRWRTPPPRWIKVNTDGSARGHKISYGGVFRDSTGHVLGCYSHKTGEEGTALEAELRACILALQIAHAKRWNTIWLESDSTQVVQLLATRSTAVPDHLKTSWCRVLGYLEDMNFRVSHIYREGNRVADCMANPDIESGWWPCEIPAISNLVYEDVIGVVNPRIRI